ncbi:large ribosomal subunit protein mL40-like [Glandiceps talaboti]
MAATCMRSVSCGLLHVQRFVLSPCRQFSRQPVLAFRMTVPLCAEPMKKKKRPVDTKLSEERERKKQKKLQKFMDKLGPAELKKIEEFKLDSKLQEKNRKRHVPKITFEESERRALLQKEWSHYRFQQHLSKTEVLERALKAQQKALDELNDESEELYDLAIQIDNTLIPFQCKGPVSTPPIKGFDGLDGEYVDITKDLK